MIALTGREEADLREFFDHLEVKPPLVGLVRQAVREFLVARTRRPELRAPKEWIAKYTRKYPPFRIVP